MGSPLFPKLQSHLPKVKTQSVTTLSPEGHPSAIVWQRSPMECLEMWRGDHGQQTGEQGNRPTLCCPPTHPTPLTPGWRGSAFFLTLALPTPNSYLGVRERPCFVQPWDGPPFSLSQRAMKAAVSGSPATYKAEME